MSGLRKLERSVIMHKSYDECGSTAMFGYLWNKHHYKEAAIIRNPEKKSKKHLASGLKNAKRILSFAKQKKQKASATNTTANAISN